MRKRVRLVAKSVRLPVSTDADLLQLALMTERSESELMRRAILELVQRYMPDPKSLQRQVA